MSREGFITVLDRVGSFDSPALWGNYPRMELREIAGDVYDGIVDEDGDPAVELAVCGREHTFGTNQSSVLWRSYRAGQPTYAWGNQRTVRHPGIQSAGTWHDPLRKSAYARFRDVRDSARDAVYRVKDPTFAYANATSIRDVLHIWAPSSDNNNPDSFAQYVVDRVNEWSAEFPVENGGEMSVAERYGIRGLIDSRHRLATRANGGPTNRRALNQKRGNAVVHYAGGAQNLSLSDMQLWQSYANWHIRDNAFGQGFAGNGIMYHVGIGRDGSKHLLTDIELDRWHCGSWPENGTHLAINLPIGGNQRATPAALKALTEVVDDWGGASGHVIGHQEADWTSCPGTLMADFVLPYREGMMTTERGRWFPQTECYIGGGFWDYWNNQGGLMIFGYPLTNEIDEDGRTVQYFERAVFEFHPENQEPHRVLLRRLGADALNRKQAA